MKQILWSKINFESRKIVGQKKFLVWRKFLVWKILSKKKFWVHKIFRSAKFFGQKRFCVQKSFWLTPPMCNNYFFCISRYCRFWWGSSWCSCSSCEMVQEMSQKLMSSLCVKLKPSSTSPSVRFWWGVLDLVLVLLVLLLVTGGKTKSTPGLKT